MRKYGIEPEKTYRIKRVADILGFDHQTVWNWVQRGYFPNAYKMGRWNIPGSDIIAFIESRQMAPAKQTAD